MLIRKIPWTRQPDGPAKLDNQSPGDFAFLTRSMGGFSTTADTSPVTELGASTQTSATKYATRLAPAPTSPWTIAVVFSPISYPTTGHGIVGFAEAPGHTTHDRSLRYTSSPSVGFSAYVYDGVEKFATVAGALRAIEVCVITCDGATLTLHRKGVGTASVAVSNFGFTGYVTPEFVIGAANSVAGTNNIISVIYDDSTAWSGSKVAVYFRGLWQLFAPQTLRIPTGVAAASSPQFDASSNSGYQAAQSTYSWSHTCSGSDRFLRVSFAQQTDAPNRAITALTYNGAALALIRSQSTGNGIGVTEWFLVAPSIGANTISVTFDGAIDSIGFAASYTGVNQSTPYESGVDAWSTTGGADATVTITSVTDNCLIVGTVVSNDLAITTGAGQTSRGLVSGALFSGASSDEGPKTPAGAVAISYTDNVASTKWAIVGYALRPATALSSLFADSDLRYSILAALQADSDQRWSVLNSANADSTTQWSLLNAALADSDQRWSALNAAQGDSSQQWSILSAALADSDMRWSLLNALQSDSTLQWSVLNAILADTDQRWSVLAGVFTDSDLRWDLQSALSAVFADSDQRWSILSAVLNDADLRHSILNAVNADSDQRWSMVNAAQADGTYQWSLIAAIQNDASLIWDLQSALAAVFQDSTLQWSLVEAIQQQLDAQWSLLNAVQIDADARWSVANAVAQDLTAQWSALGAAYKDATIQWDSLTVGESTTTLSWSIQSEAAPAKIISIVFSTKTRSIVFSAKPN